MKKLIGLLLALCLIVGLLPVVAFADEVQFDGAAKICLLGHVDMYVKEGGEAKYVRTTNDGEAKTCTAEEDWNIKFEYVDDWAVLTLKGAQLGKSDGNGNYAKDYMRQVHAIEAPLNSPFYRLKVIVEEDSVFDTGFGGIICQGTNDSVMMSDIWIESVGDAKLDIFCPGGYPALRAANYDTYEGTLTINANLNITQVVDYRYATCFTASHVVVNGGNIVLNSANACIDALKSLTINDGNITMNCSNGAMVSPVQMPNGEVTINGGTVYGEGYTYAINASEVAFNSGVIELKALSEEGDARVFIDGAPDLAQYKKPAAVIGSSKDDVAKYTPDLALETETGYFMLAAEGTPEAPNVPADEPDPTEPPATEPPATEPPATSEAPEDTKAPEESKDDHKDDNKSEGNSDWILWVVVAAMVVAAGVVAFIIVKKNSATNAQEDDQAESAE